MGSEEGLQRLLEAVTDHAIFLLDREGRVLTWNTGAQRLTGYTQGQVIGEHFSRRLYPPQDVDAGEPERALQAACEHGHYEDEGWRVRRDGSRFWADVVITALRDDAGQVVGFAQVTRDLGSHLQANDRLRLVAERERIAKELQAGTIKVLFAVGLHLQALAAASGEAPIQAGIQECIAELDGAIYGLRSYLFGLDSACVQPAPEEERWSGAPSWRSAHRKPNRR